MLIYQICTADYFLYGLTQFKICIQIAHSYLNYDVVLKKTRQCLNSWKLSPHDGAQAQTKSANV